MQKFDEKTIVAAWTQILTGLGLDIKDPNFVGTPERISDMYKEVFAGLLTSNLEKLEDHLTRTFPCSYDQMIIVKDINAWSMCPHHFLPVQYNVHLAYLPNEQVLGLSKPARVVQMLAKRPVLQEQLTDDIVDYLERVLKPRGVAVQVTGVHHCMVTRGVKANASATTRALTGAFRDPFVKQEFLASIQ